MRSIACCFLSLTGLSSLNQCSSDNNILRLPNKKSMVVCNNSVVNDIPGGPKAILLLGEQYLLSMKNYTKVINEKFKGNFAILFYSIQFYFF
jgi:hypothetical protein